ncbi:hypothetical protein C0Q70_04704 [Pomacea canaliculata]|uniref:Uncharacterized protein n=1 Tax=Pomacea canaliculata TaxID=400727 RepID=A0A2T7PJ48_POMCA|nr:hypothetical protein C0Q70_04704 [Pomacea canaliculata]
MSADEEQCLSRLPLSVKRQSPEEKKLVKNSIPSLAGLTVVLPWTFRYSDSSSRDLLDSEIVLAQSDSATAHGREDIAETGEKQIRSSCSPTPLQKTAVDESRRLDGPLEAEEQTDEDGQKVASISGLSDTASSTKDSEHHQTSELTAPDSQCPRVESATKTSEKTGEEKSKGHLKEGSVSPLLETASSPLDSEHYIPSKSTEKIGEQTGEGGLQAAPVQVLLDTVSSPLDSDHYMHSKMIGTASEPTLRDTKMSLPDTGFISDGHLPKEMDDSGEIVMRKESILDMLDTVGSPMDSGQPCQPTDTTSFLEASESGSNDSVKVKETEDIPETASEAGSHDVSSRQTTTEPQDTGFQTDSQYAEAPVETVSEDDTRNSVSPNLPDDEKQDCNRSAVTSSRTNHLARVETWSRSPSLVPQKVKTTGSLELQKSPAKKYKKLKRRSSRRDNLNKRCEELLLPINKWKTLLDGILPANEESTPTLWSSGSRRSRRTNNPNTKHRKRSASQNAASSLSTKTTLDTSDKQPRPPFHLDDTTEASSGPSPPKGMVGAQKKRTSLRTYNPSSGKLPKVTESNSAPREDRFPHGDESGAHVSRSRLTKALDASTNRSLPLDPCPSSSHQFKTDNITIPQVKKNPSHMSKSRNDARSDSTSSNILTTVTSLPCPPGQQPKDPHLQSLTSSCPSSAHKLQKTAHKQPVREMTAVSQSNSEKKGTGLPYCSKRMSTADIEAWLLEEQNKQEWKGRRVQKETHPTREKLRRPASSSDGPRLQTFEILEDGVHHKPTSKVRLLGVVRGKRRQTGLCPMSTHYSHIGTQECAKVHHIVDNPYAVKKALNRCRRDGETVRDHYSRGGWRSKITGYGATFDLQNNWTCTFTIHMASAETAAPLQLASLNRR